MAHKPDYLVQNRGRRRFLMGAASTALALPFLESLANPTPSYGWAPAAGMPRRLIVLFHAHGSIMDELIPGPNYEPGAILQPVADAGLLHKTMVVSGVTSKTEKGHDGGPTLLTCTPTGPDGTHGNGSSQSIEHRIATHMQDGGIARRLDVTVTNNSTNPEAGSLTHQHTRIFWAGDNAGIESIQKPQVAFDRVFPDGPPGQNTSEPEVDTRAIRRASVLDRVIDSFARLRGRVSASDRERLDLHADQLRQIELSLQNGGGTGPVSTSCNDGLNLSFSGLDHAGVADAQVDILAHAIACNVADVGTFKIGDLDEANLGHITHPQLAEAFDGGNYHGTWHKASDNEPAARNAFIAINAWHGSLFARLMSRLEQFDEGDGTALDNTMIVWISDFGRGDGHRSTNLHLALAGHAGGAPLGRHVSYSPTPAQTVNSDPNQPGNHNLAVTMQQAFGISDNTFGNYQDTYQPVQPGPLSL